MENKNTKKAKILVVDDEEINREIMCEFLGELGYESHTCDNGADALMYIASENFDLVLLDVSMPFMSGTEVLRKIRENKKYTDIPILMVTGSNTLETKVLCIKWGANDFLLKPFDKTILTAQIKALLEKKRLLDIEKEHKAYIEDQNKLLWNSIQEQVRMTTKAQQAMIFALATLAESRDPDTGEHLERMQEYCRLIAEEMAKNEKYNKRISREYVDSLYAAAPLHDIGKVGIPDHILLKPGRLTPEEFEIMKTHVTIGADTLRNVNQNSPGNMFVNVGIDIAEGHHEKWDGSGYPNGLAREDIPLSARILALGDVYDALTSERCYKKAISHEDTCKIIVEGKGSHFDPDIIDAFLRIEKDFKRIKEELHDSEESINKIQQMP